MHIKYCESNKSTIPPKQYGERCLQYLERKFASSGEALQQLSPEQVHELRTAEHEETSTGSSSSATVVTEEPQGSPSHNKAKNTPSPGGVVGEGGDVYHSTAL